MQQGSKKAMTFRIQSMKHGPMWIAAILVYQFLKPPQLTHLLHSHPPHPHNTCPQLYKHQPNQLCHTNHHQPLQLTRSDQVSKNKRSPLSDLLNLPAKPNAKAKTGKARVLMSSECLHILLEKEEKIKVAKEKERYKQERIKKEARTET